MYKPILLLITCLSISLCNAQIAWQKVLGGSAEDLTAHIEETADGGYIFTATSPSTDGNVAGGLQANHGGTDAWVVKMTATNTVQWKRCLGGTADETATSILKTSDGGYLLIADTRSTNGDISGNHGGADLWIVKLTAAGAISWQKCYGGTGDETVSPYSSCINTTDGNIAVIAKTNATNNGDVGIGNGGGWLLKINATNGNIIWQKLISGSWGDEMFALAQTPDGGFAVAGRGGSPDIPTGSPPTPKGQTDIILSKVNATGTTIEWAKMYGGSDAYDGGHGVAIANDGTIFVVGNVMATDGDCLDKHGGVWESDGFVAAVSSTGTTLWTNCVGGNGTFDVLLAAKPTSTGNVLVGGWVSGNGGDVGTYIGYEDVWIAELNKTNGNIISEDTYGGTGQDRCIHLQIVNGGYLIAAQSSSTDGDLSLNNGQRDAWLFKVNSACTFTPIVTGNNMPCSNGTYSYSVPAVTGATYNWSVVGGTIHSGAGTNTIQVIWSNATTGTVNITQTNP